MCYLLYLSNKVTCAFCGSDFDECSVYGTCSQSCTNTEGSYTCSCVEGYLSQPDNRSCKAKNGKYQQTAAALNVHQFEWYCADVLFVFLLLTVSYVHVTSASRPSACPVDCQLPEHPSHLPERHHCPQPAIHQHQTNHSHGLCLRPGDCLLDPCRRLPLIHTPQMCQNPQSEELHRGESHQHLSQPSPWVHHSSKQPYTLINHG